MEMFSYLLTLRPREKLPVQLAKYELWYRLQGPRDGSSPAHWYKSRSVMLASMKARQMLTWILGKEDSKFKHCENLQVL